MNAKKVVHQPPRSRHFGIGEPPVLVRNNKFTSMYPQRCSGQRVIRNPYPYSEARRSITRPHTSKHARTPARTDRQTEREGERGRISPCLQWCSDNALKARMPAALANIRWSAQPHSFFMLLSRLVDLCRAIQDITLLKTVRKRQELRVCR